MPGRASSARMSSAIRPPSRKNTKDVTMYMIPICFASVVRRIRASAEPLDLRPDRPGPGHDRLRRDGRHGWPPVSRSSHSVRLNGKAYLAGRIVPHRVPAGGGWTKSGMPSQRRYEAPVLVGEDPSAAPPQHRIAQCRGDVAGPIALVGTVAHLVAARTAPLLVPAERRPHVRRRVPRAPRRGRRRPRRPSPRPGPASARWRGPRRRPAPPARVTSARARPRRSARPAPSPWRRGSPGPGRRSRRTIPVARHGASAASGASEAVSSAWKYNFRPPIGITTNVVPATRAAQIQSVTGGPPLTTLR